MKRIKAACVCQTLHFQLKEGVEHNFAVESVRQEVAYYKKQLERKGTQYKILGGNTLAAGSILLKIIKQYNQSPLVDYLN